MNVHTPVALGTPLKLGEQSSRHPNAFRHDGADGFRATRPTFDLHVSPETVRFRPIAGARNIPSSGALQQAATFELARARVAVEGAPSRAGLRAEGAVTVRRLENGVLQRELDGVVETLQGGANGFEQSWTFQRAPEGGGALRVEVPFSGLDHVLTNASGAHFVDGRTGLGVRYGHGTWIDAAGRRTAVPVKVEGEALVLSVPAQVLAASRYPAVLDPVVSPEQGIDAPILGPANNGQSTPAVTANGAGFVAAWMDDRMGQAEIMAARLSNTGTPIDSTGLFVGQGSNVAVASSGTTALLVWTSGFGVQGALLTDAGTLTPLAPLFTSTLAPPEHPTVAWNGSSFIVAFENGEGRVGYVRVGTDGGVLPSSYRVPHASGATGQVGPAIAVAGSTALITWDGADGAVSGTRVNAAGEVTDATPLQLGTGAGSRTSAIAANATDFLVAWTALRNDAPDVFAARVSGAVAGQAAVLDTTPLSLTNDSVAQGSLSARWNGSAYVVVWDQAMPGSGYEVFAARVGPTGTLIGTTNVTGTILGGYNYRTAVGLSASNTLLILWQHNGSGSGDDVYAVRLAADGSTDATATLVTASANGQRRSKIAENGSGYLVAWEDRPNSEFAIKAARLNAAGEAQGPSLELATGPQLKTLPAVAAAGGTYLVVWREFVGATYELRGVRVSSAGAVLDGSPRSYATSAQVTDLQALTSDGTNFYLAYAESTGAGQPLLIRGLRIGANGTALGTATTLATATTLNEGIGAAWNGTEYLVSFSGTIEGVDAVHVARANASGTVVGSPVALSDPGTGFGTSGRASSIGCEGPSCLVAWQQQAAGGAIGVFARAVGANGGPTSPIRALAASGLGPSIGADNWGFWVTWTRTGGTRPDVVGARVTREGVVLDVNPLAISATETSENESGIAALGNGNAVAVYSLVDTTPGVAAPRIRARALSSAAPSAAALQLTTGEDIPVAVNLSGSDADADPLGFVITTPPANGTLSASSGAGLVVTYTPGAEWSGTDTFEYAVTDGQTTSGSALVTITVTAIDDPPIAVEQTVTTPEETPVTITLVGTDAEGQPVTLALASQPEHGTLTGAPPTVVYTPAKDFFGTDSFTFTGSDGNSTGAPGRITIQVTNTNDRPRALSQTIEVFGPATPVTLTGEDPDGDALTFILESQPEFGVLTGDAPNLQYSAPLGKLGTTTFRFRVSDGTLTSDETAEITLVVKDGPEPESKCGCGAGGDVGPVALALVMLMGMLVLRQRRATSVKAESERR